MIIREDIPEYLAGLKAWLAQTQEADLEEMGAFFERRLEGYEEHMSVWREAYRRFARLLPAGCKELLDLGCGTGLELGEIWKRDPAVSVTGVDLCQAMLGRLARQYADKPFRPVCGDYFRYDMGQERWDAVISFESLHHFFPEKKRKLYEKIHRGLKEEGVFLLGDYIACCQEEEDLLRNVYLEKMKKRPPAGPGETDTGSGYVHFDIPLTLEHELELLTQAGFCGASAVDCVEGATMIVAFKRA